MYTQYQKHEIRYFALSVISWKMEEKKKQAQTINTVKGDDLNAVNVRKDIIIRNLNKIRIRM